MDYLIPRKYGLYKELFVMISEYLDLCDFKIYFDAWTESHKYSSITYVENMQRVNTFYLSVCEW